MTMIKKLLLPLISFVSRKTGYYLVRQGTVLADKRQVYITRYLNDLYKLIDAVPGAVVECGVGRMRTFITLAALVEAEQKNRILWGFDSFEGFPQPTAEDASFRSPRKGEWKLLTPEDALRVLEASGFSSTFTSKQIKLVKGFVEDSLVEYDGQPIAFLHVDVDLYSAHKHILETLVPLVAQGGVVLLDDYKKERWPGATQAVDEYLKGKSWVVQEHLGKHYFIKQ